MLSNTHSLDGTARYANKAGCGMLRHGEPFAQSHEGADDRAMMLPSPLSWIRKILRILKSNLSPSQIAIAFALGVFAGLPPMGLHILLPCSLALLLRCSFRSFLISMGLFKLISLAGAPGAFAVGRWLLDSQRGLDAFWRRLFHLPVLAPMGYGRYLLLGSLVLALLIAVPVFVLVRLLVIRYRVSFANWVSGWRLSAWMRDRRGTGLARRLLAGGKTKYEAVAPPRGAFRFIRREMLIGLPLLYAICYLLAALIVPFFAGTLTTTTASWIVGSEVAVEESSFNLFTGGLTLANLRIQDPKQTDENLIAIPSVSLDAGMTALLAKRVVFNRIVISDASLHVKREPDGTLNIDNTTSGWDATGYMEWASRYADKVDWLGLLRAFVEYLGELRPLAPREDPYARYRGGRSFLGFRPPFAIERLEIGRVLVTLEDDFAQDAGAPLPPLTLLEIEISGLAFPPELRNRPIEIQLRGQLGDDPESGFRLAAIFEASAAGTSSQYEFAMTRIDLARIARVYETTLPVRVLSGLATMSGSLRLESSAASGEASFLIEDLMLAGDSDRPLFGLPPETSARVLDGINRYALEIPIVFGTSIGGSSTSPKLEWEAPLLQIAKEGLMMIGERHLASTIESLGLRIDALGGVDQSLLDPDFETLRDQTEQAARQLIEDTGSSYLDRLELPLSSPASQTPSANPIEGLPLLLRDLLRPPSETEDGDETDAG